MDMVSWRVVVVQKLVLVGNRKKAKMKMNGKKLRKSSMFLSQSRTELKTPHFAWYE
jgi:hypothetical protein